MEHSDSSVLLAWIALGQAAPVVALGVVCLVCAALVAVVIGGISAFGANARVSTPRGTVGRLALSACALCAGGFSLKLMLGGMNIDGFELFKAVGLYALAMSFFVGAQYASAADSGVAEEVQAERNTCKASSRGTHKKAA
ncbi:MAG: hypothetical protein ACK54H_11120 [Phycisphaerales bacterium]